MQTLKLELMLEIDGEFPMDDKDTRLWVKRQLLHEPVSLLVDGEKLGTITKIEIL